jgi:hypothetical protein
MRKLNRETFRAMSIQTLYDLGVNVKPGLGGVTSINTGYLLPVNDYRAWRRVIDNLAWLRLPMSSASPRMPMGTKIRPLRGSHIDAPYEPG